METYLSFLVLVCTFTMTSAKMDKFEEQLKTIDLPNDIESLLDLVDKLKADLEKEEMVIDTKEAFQQKQLTTSTEANAASTNSEATDSSSISSVVSTDIGSTTTDSTNTGSESTMATGSPTSSSDASTNDGSNPSSGSTDGGSTITGASTDGGSTITGASTDGGSTITGASTDGGSTITGASTDGGSTITGVSTDGGSTITGVSTDQSTDGDGSTVSASSSPPLGSSEVNSVSTVTATSASPEGSTSSTNPPVGSSDGATDDSSTVTGSPSSHTEQTGSTFSTNSLPSRRVIKKSQQIHKNGSLLPKGSSCTGRAVSFSAVRKQTTISSQGPVIFDQIVANLGAGFSNPNFVAPCTGTYAFRAEFELAENTASPAFVELIYENEVILKRQLGTKCNCAGDITSINLDIHLVKGEKLWMRIVSTRMPVQLGNFHLFTGRLLSGEV